MKIKKLYETLSVDQIFKSITEYNEMLIILKPIALKEYYKLANKKNYHPDYGDTPDKNISDHDLYISELVLEGDQYLSQKIMVILTWRGEHSTEEFYVYLSKKKIEKALLELTANKYNL